MKQLLVAILLAGAAANSAFASLASSSADIPTAATTGAPADEIAAKAEAADAAKPFKMPDPKEWCPAGGTLDRPVVIKPTKAGSVDTINNCKIKNGMTITVDGSNVTSAVRVQNTAASTFSVTNTKIGARAVLVVKGVDDHDVAKDLVPFNVNIHNNVFETDGHLHIRGAFPPHSSIIVTGNTFSVVRPLDARFPLGLENATAMAISIGETYLWQESRIKIDDNDISAKDTKGRFQLRPIAFRDNMYWYGTNSSVEITNNRINALCNPALRVNNTACAFGIRGDHTHFMYTKSSQFIVDHNTFNVTGGLFWKFPQVVAHIASARISASHNKGYSYSEKTAVVDPVRRYAPFTEFGILNLGAQTYLDVNYNEFHCKGKSGILGFPTDLTATDHVFVSIRGNEIYTRGCSPSIYFMHTFAMTQKAVLWISQNIQSRVDNATSGLASIYFAGEFAVQHASELCINNNTFGHDNTIKHKTKMVGLAPSAINSWKVEETATISMCDNVYNGTDVHEEYLLKPHIALKIQEVVIADECRTERRPYSDDFEPGGADDVVYEAIEYGEDVSGQYNRMGGLNVDEVVERDPENTNEDLPEEASTTATEAADSDSAEAEL